MILKFYEINKINFSKNKFILFYGKNEGLKDQSIKQLIGEKDQISYYDEKEILENAGDFIESILSKSLFDNEKIIVIKRVSDKIVKIIEEISSKNLEDLIIIFNSVNLEKKSKLRSFFEKHKTYICAAFFPDTEQTLLKLAQNFLKDKKLLISTSNLNLIINKCNGDRENLKNELQKIEEYSKSGKEISEHVVTKLTNLSENHNISELIDYCLAKNKKKIIYILNENNFSNDDCILITRTFLNKAKKLFSLSSEYKINKNLELTISSAKPPIFWKNKEITKDQILKWPPQDIKKLLYKINQLELQIKKNIGTSINLVVDFILDQVSV